VQLFRLVLNKLAGSRSSDLRSAYLCLVWDQIATGRKKGLFACRGVDSCPLCSLPNFLDHVVLRCPALVNRRKEIWDDVMRPYEFGVIPAAGFPTACTDWVRAYLRAYIKMAFNTDSKIADSNALSMWMSHPLYEILSLLEIKLSSVPMSNHELRYLRKVFLPVLAKLLHGARCLWLLRCSEAFSPASGYSSMTSTRLSPHSTQFSISSFMSPGFWLSSYDSDISDDDDDGMTPADSAADEVGACSVRFSYADDPDLAHFVSVANLQRTPGSTDIDFSLLCLGIPAEGTGSKARRAARSSLPSPFPSPLPHPASGRPIRDSRVNMGHSADLPLESDVNSVGLLPSFFVNMVTPGLHKLGPADYRFSWVQDSHFCSGGGKGFFFSISPDRILPVGTLIGVYSGRDTKNLHLTYPQAQRRFANSDYVLAAPRSRYAVDGEDGLTIGGPARSNDNFDLFNCYFAYNPSSTPPRMELITKGPMAGGASGAVYEVFTNCDAPGRPPAYWTASARTAFQRRPWPAASPTIPPGSAPLDDPVQFTPCMPVLGRGG
jgi:hypothetical protein